MIATPHEATDRLNDLGKRKGVLQAEVIAVIVSLIVIALLGALDIAHTAHAAPPVVQATSAAAPPAGWAALKPQADDRWAADESARGTRPDAIH